MGVYYLFFLQAEDGIRDDLVTGVQTCALPSSDDIVGKQTLCVIHHSFSLSLCCFQAVPAPLFVYHSLVPYGIYNNDSNIRLILVR